MVYMVLIYRISDRYDFKVIVMYIFKFIIGMFFNYVVVVENIFGLRLFFGLEIFMYFE